MSVEEIQHKIKTDFDKVIEEVKALEKGTIRETHETYLASEILLKLSSGDKVTEAQIRFLKEQSIYVAKALALIGLQAVPGSSLAIIALEKIAEKHGFTLFPKAQNDPLV